MKKINMVWIKFFGALSFVVGISFVFYASEKYVFGRSRDVKIYKRNTDAEQLKFRVTNLFNEGVPNAIIYLSLDSPSQDYRNVQLTNKMGETTFTSIPAGTYFWKIVTGDSTLNFAKGKFNFLRTDGKVNMISVCLERANGNFSKLSLNN